MNTVALRDGFRPPGRGSACAFYDNPFRSRHFFYDYFMSVAFWMRPFFTDFCRYGENRKAVDNEWIAWNCAGLQSMSISTFYALQNQCTGDELGVGSIPMHFRH